MTDYILFKNNTLFCIAVRSVQKSQFKKSKMNDITELCELSSEIVISFYNVTI